STRLPVVHRRRASSLLPFAFEILRKLGELAFSMTPAAHRTRRVVFVKRSPVIADPRERAQHSDKAPIADKLAEFLKIFTRHLGHFAFSISSLAFLSKRFEPSALTPSQRRRVVERELIDHAADEVAVGRIVLVGARLALDCSQDDKPFVGCLAARKSDAE